jgi:hypothetical protein
MEDILISSGNRAKIAYFKNTKVAVYMQDAPPADKATTGTTGTVSAKGSPIVVANWGDDNDFPGMISKILAKDAELKELINTLVLYAMGKGVTAFFGTDIDDDGNPLLKPVKDLEVINFYKSRMVRKFLLEGYQDLFTFFNVFPEMIPTKDRTKIHTLQINEASHSRWAQMDDSGVLATVIHNKNWPSAKLGDPAETTIIPALDVYDPNIVQSVKDNKALRKWIFPVSYPTIGQTYYQLAHWDGLRVSGWLDIASKIPEFKKALLSNQMTIKYLIRIPNHYWPSAFAKWADMSEDVQNAKKKEKLQEINNALTDVENTGKSILNEVGYDPITKEKLPGWEIEVIDDKTKAGAFNEDSQEASAFKMRALGLDNSIVGNLMTGKSLSGGGGSDKRIAWNLFMAKIGPYRDIMIDPLMFVAEFNGWADKYPGFTLVYRDTVMETLDKAHQTSTPVNNAA